MPVGPVPVAPAIDVAKLCRSMIDLAPTEFPIGMRFRVPVETPQDLSEAEITSEIDTSAWFDNGDDVDVFDEAQHMADPNR